MMTSVTRPRHLHSEPVALKAYWLATEDGELHRFGVEHTAQPLVADERIISLSGTADGMGCYALDSSGRVHVAGTARHAGDLTILDHDVDGIQISCPPTGPGYWVLDRAGSVYAFGGAPWVGGLPQVTNDAGEAIALRGNPRGGYWIIDRWGALYGFGRAESSLGLGEHIDTRRVRIVDFAPDPGAPGFWVLEGIGGVFAIGDSDYHGSPTELSSIEAIAVLADNDGYVVVDARGAVLAFGSAIHRGSLVGLGQRVCAAG